MTTGVIVLIVIAVIVVIALIWAVTTYNGFVRLRNLVQEAWRQIDVELHQVPQPDEAVVRGDGPDEHDHDDHGEDDQDDDTGAHSRASRRSGGSGDRSAGRQASG